MSNTFHKKSSLLNSADLARAKTDEARLIQESEELLKKAGLTEQISDRILIAAPPVSLDNIPRPKR